MCKTLVMALACLAGVHVFGAATPVAIFDGATLADGATYALTNGVTYTLSANGNSAIDGGGIQISGGRGVSVSPASGSIGNQASTVIIRYTGYDTSALGASDAQALIINHNSSSFKDMLGVAATQGGNLWGVWNNEKWGENKTTSGKYGSVAANVKKFALAWDHDTAVQQGAWFWMDGADKQGWSTLHGDQQVDSVWIGGPNESTTVTSATGMKILSIAVFDRRLTDDEITSFKFPCEGGVAAYGAIWGNCGTSASDPGAATKSDNSSKTETGATICFAANDNITQKGIGTNGTARISKIRIAKSNARSGILPVCDYLTLTQEGREPSVSISAVERKEQPLWWATKAEKSMTFYEYVFASDVEFDVTKDITLTFSGKQSFYTIQPANSVCKCSTGYSPAIEVTGDWTPQETVTTPTHSLGFDNGKGASAVLGGTAPTGVQEWESASFTKVRESETDYAMGLTAETHPYAALPSGMADGQSWSVHAAMKLANVENGTLFALSPAVWQNCKYIGVEYIGQNKVRVVYGTAKGADNKKTLIGSVTVPGSTVRYHSYLLTFNAGASGTVTSPYYTFYVDGVKAGDSGAADKVTGYAVDWCIGSYYGGAGQVGSAIFAGAAVDDFAIWKDTCLSAGQAADLASKFPTWPKPVEYVAKVTGDAKFSDLDWTPARPAKGFSESDTLTISNTVTAKVTFDESVTAGGITLANAAGAALSLAFEPAAAVDATWDFTTAKGGATLDASGLDGTELAKNAVAGAPYSHWLLTGMVDGMPEVSCPKLPAGYSIMSEVLPNYGARLIVTAPDSAKLGSISVNISNGTAIGEGNHGVHPIDQSQWNELTKSKLSGTFSGATFTLSGKTGTFYGCGGVQDLIQKDYVDDGNGQSITLTITDVPFSRYRIIAYYNSDSGVPFCPMTVNGVSYAGLTADGEASATVRGSTANWGLGSARGTMAEGCNCLVSDVITETAATVTIYTTNRGTARGTPAAFQVVKVGEVPTNYFLTMDGDTDASTAAWTPKKTAAFSSGDTLTITCTAARATFTADEDIAVGKLKIVSEAGKLWVFKKNAGITTDFGSLDFSEAVDGVGYDCTEGFTACRLLLDYARKHDEKFTFFGAGENGALIDYGTEQKDYTFGGHYIFDGGTNTFQHCSESASLLFGANATADNPTFWVKDNTTLFFKSRNPCGWNAAANTNGIIRIGDGAKVVAQNSAAGTWYWSQQFWFDPGATLEIGTEGNNFRTVGNNENAPHFYMPASAGGEARITGADDNWLVLSSDNGAAMNFNVGEGSTLIVSANLKTLSSGKPFGKYGKGTLRLTGDTSAFAPTVTVSEGTLEFANGATNRISQALVNNGTILVSDGVVAFMDGAVPGKVETSGTGKYYYGYTVDINMLGKFKLPDGRSKDDVMLFDLAGNVVPFTENGNVLEFEWGVTDGNCWWDYEFNGNVKSTGTDATEMTREGTEPFFNTASNALWVGHATHYRGATYPAEFTAVMRGRIVSTSNQVEVGFGSTTAGSKYSVALACGNTNENEVLLLISKEKTVVDTVTMHVDNAYTGDHLYAFTCATVDDGSVAKTRVTVYLDGLPLQNYTLDEQVSLGSGFQIGSVHGGVPTGYAKATSANANSFLDFLRTYPLAASAEAMAKYAEKHPYVSPNGTAVRKFGGAANWTAKDAWSILPYEGDPYVTNKPPAKANVVISATTASVVTFDLAEAAKYESFTVTNGAAVTLRKGGTQTPFVSGFTTVGANLTVDYGAMDLTKSPIIVEAGRTLTFDFSSFNLAGCWASATNELTGSVTFGENAQVLSANMPTSAGRKAELVQNATTHCYELRITVENLPFVCTVDDTGWKTWTWAGEEVEESDVDAHPQFDIWKEGEGTLSKAIDRTFVVREGTLKATSAGVAKVTIEENGTFDVNGKGDSTYTVVLAGGRLVNNSSNEVPISKKQYESIALTRDSTIGGSSDFSLTSTGYAGNILDLDGNTLYKVDDNTFTLANTTVTNGTVVVSNGTLRVSMSSTIGSSRFVDADLVLHGTLRIVTGQTLTIGHITATNSATIWNTGTMSAFALDGEATLSGAGKWGEITLDGALDVGTVRGLTIGGEGTVALTLTTAETRQDVSAANPIKVFTPDAAKKVTISKIIYEGADITSRCEFSDGKITKIIYEAMIGSQKYATMQDAVNAVSSGQTITLLENVTLPQEIAKSFTIDLSGKEMTNDSVRISGSVVYKDSSSAKTGCVCLWGDAPLTVVYGGKLTVTAVPAKSSGGTVVVNGGEFVVSGNVDLGDAGVAVYDGGTLNLSGTGTLTCRCFKSSGTISGANVALVVTETMDASARTAVGFLRLADGATLSGTGLEVSGQLEFGRTLNAESLAGSPQIATVTGTVKTEGVRVTYNGRPGFALSVDDTALSVVWFANNWIAYADETGVEKSGGKYVVTNEDGLAWIAAQAADKWFCGNVELGADLDLSLWNWTPIAAFTGTFDGKGHVITGINNTNVVDELGAAGRYPCGPTNVWGHSAYGLFATATNAVFRNVAFADVAIDSAAEAVAPLLGIHEDGVLEACGVTVRSGCVCGSGGSVAGVVGKAENWSDLLVANNENAASVEVASAAYGTPRWVAGIVTVGGETVGPLVVTNNVNGGKIRNALFDGVAGGNAAQVLAGTAADTVFGGKVIATGNAGDGTFDVTVAEGDYSPAAWDDSMYGWLPLPVCNLAFAVVRTDSDGIFWRFVEANDPDAGPAVDPVYGTARMLSGLGANGIKDDAGWWTDRISAVADGGTVLFPETNVTFDVWATVCIDRNVTLDLNTNCVYGIYDCNVFVVAEGKTLTLKNGTIYYAEGFSPTVGSIVLDNVKTAELAGDFYQRTVPLSGLGVEAGFVTIEVPHSSSCFYYVVDSTPTLAEDWTLGTNYEPGNGGPLELKARSVGESGFYRVRIVDTLPGE